ncbi:MAG: NADPH-dependent FMN reductase, partial [Bacteroidia bacterium]
VMAFRKKIEQAHAVIICTPEYAFGIPGVLKNALDWTVSSGEFSDKPTALITASSSGEKAHRAMSWVLDALGAAPAENCRLLIPFIRSKISPEGHITDEGVRAAVDSVLKSVIACIHKKTGAE